MSETQTPHLKKTRLASADRLATPGKYAGLISFETAVSPHLRRVSLSLRSSVW